MSNRSNYNVIVKNRFAQLDSDAESEENVQTTVEVPKPEKRYGAKTQQESVKGKKNGRDESRTYDEAKGKRTTENKIRSQESVKEKPKTERGRRVRFHDEKTTGGSESDPERRSPYRSNPPGRAPLPSHFKKDLSGTERRDRRSGTGRGREIKKKGAGGHNWGADASLMEEGTQNGSATHDDPEGTGGANDPSDEPENGKGDVIKEKTEEAKCILFADYQKNIRQKHLLLKESNPSPRNVRSIDASVFEKEGLRRYEKEVTQAERQEKEMLQKLGHHNEVIDSELEYTAVHKKSAAPAFQFKRPETHRRRNFTNAKQIQKPIKKVNKEHVDLNDSKIFPSLLE